MTSTSAYGPLRDVPWRRMLSALALISCLLAWPQRSYSGWQTFSTQDGLVGNNTSSLLEDREGNIWIGTYSGVSRYDGITWRNFTVEDGLADRGVEDVAQDLAGNLWFATLAGVSRYDGSTWRTFTTADGLACDRVSSICADQEGNVWFACGDAVTRYDGTTWRTFTMADGVRSTSYITQDRSGGLWFIGSGGASRYDGATWLWLTTQSLRCMAEDHAGNLWFGLRSGGVSRFDGTVWQTFLEGTEIRSIWVDRWGTVWFAGPGVHRFDGSNWQAYTILDGLAYASPREILGDASGNLWFATARGLNRYDGSSWHTLTVPDAAYALVSRSLEDASGRVWIESGPETWVYDGATWRVPDEVIDAPTGYSVSGAVLKERGGSMWFSLRDSAGTYAGVGRYDGSTWTYMPSDGTPSGLMMEDRAGNLWFVGSGVSRFDGSTWQHFTRPDGLGHVMCIAGDSAGNVWLGTYGGASRFDGASWRTFTDADGLSGIQVYSILQDQSGTMWFGSYPGGVTRFDGSTWEIIPGAGSGILSSLEDRERNLWFSSWSGVTRYDGSTWTAITIADGLAHNWVYHIMEDRSGNLWFSTRGGLTRFEPDRVPPRTVFLSAPQSLSPSPSQVAAFTAAFLETRIEFSHRLDGGVWSPWSSSTTWGASGLTDGTHTLEVRSRDMWNNVEETPAVTSFEIDASPPEPVLISPLFGAPVQGLVEIRGTTADARFDFSRIQMRRSGVTTWDSPEAVLLAESTTPVTNGFLATWDTSTLADGAYDLRVAVLDSLGLTGAAHVTLVVDNHAPFFDQTTPAKVVAAIGGDIYTTNAEAHLYFPPQAFQEDALVMVVPLDAASVPSSPREGAVKVLDGYELAWAGTLRKPARFTLRCTGTSSPPGTIAVYRSADGSVWEREGGTVDNARQSVELAVTLPGRYALFADDGRGSGESSLSSIAFTPRVFSPTGGFADRQVGISFRLGRPATVTVKVFSRSGRLIREVLAGAPMSAGENLVRWDGTDRNGGIVTDDMYLVMVQALGHTETKLLAVVK